MRKDFIRDRHEQNTMHFIIGIKEKKESFEKTVLKAVERETGILLKTIELLSCNEGEYFFHASLTDADVNHIVRGEGEIIEFFSLKELETSMLSEVTRTFITKHRDVLEKVDAM